MAASKHVVVTGASSGIGRGIAKAFDQPGYKLSLVARRKEFGAEIEVRRELSKMLGALERVGGEVGIEAAAIEIGHWDCDFSPIGICVYDGYEDPIQDNCLYCNYPEERK